MAGFIKRLLGQKPQTSRSQGSRPRETLPQQIRLPAEPPLVYVVGDIHGCLDLYQKLETQIMAEAAGARVLIVLVGDLVDRGPDSAGVIRHLMAPPPEGAERLVLMGNHEQMMLEFFKAPRAHIRWLDYGGRTTLASYGIDEAQMGLFTLPEGELADKMRALLPPEHLAWIRSLPGAVRLGPRYFVSHSGLNPDKPLSEQSARDLMWSRNIKGMPPEGVTVIHGHTPIETVDLTGPFIDIDTGVYATGRLSAVRLTPGEAPVLLEVSGP
jgi:serine/threonine protein phosphatase 1